MFSKTCKVFLSWCFAFVIAVLCANLISFFYRSGSGSIPRENAFSNNIRTPNSRIVRGSEGYGINLVDKNGYVNSSNLPLSDNYILLMGSSHAEGLQVMQKQNMVTVLNNMIDTNTRTVYNLGTAGYDLPLIIQGFQAGIEEFPNSSAIIIEIPQMACDSNAIIEALDQVRFDASDSGEELVQSQSLSRRIRNTTLGLLPVISLLRQQIDSISFDLNGAFGIQASSLDNKTTDANTSDENNSEENSSDDNIGDATISVEDVSASSTSDHAFYDALDQAFALLRSEYHNPIILLYHPKVSLQPDGTITVDREVQYYDDYLSACENNDITFVDVGDAFLSAYETDYSMPYGFSNTTMPTGHLNSTGHRIVAEELYKALLKIQSEEKK